MAPGPGAHPAVGIDLAPGTAEAMRHLAQLGHKDVLWVPMTLGGRVTDPERDACVRLAAQVAGLDLTTLPISAEAIGGLEAIGPYVEQSRRQFAAMLCHGRPPSAVVAYTERSAMGICAALADAGVRVPHDVSVVAFDDIYAHLATLPLTVVSIRLRAVGERAAEVAMEMVDGAGPLAAGRAPVERIPTELVIRGSTACGARPGRARSSSGIAQAMPDRRSEAPGNHRKRS